MWCRRGKVRGNKEEAQECASFFMGLGIDNFMVDF
jgi:hypothetical protein